MIKSSKNSEPNKNDAGRTVSQKSEQKVREAEESSPMRKAAKEKGQSSDAKDWFRKFAHKTSEIVGSPWSFIIAVATLIIWAALGPASGFSDTWQLIINTATTIVTFLMVFLIQNTQNRDAKAIHLKLDELIHAVKGARNNLINLEDLSEDELKKIEKQFKRVSKMAERTLPKAKDSPEK